MSVGSIIIFSMIGAISLTAIVYLITHCILVKSEMKNKMEIELKKADAKKMYFTFESDDDKTIKAFRIVVDKNVNTEDFIEYCERYTDPLFEYNMNHQRLNKDEFNLLKEVLKDD